MEESKQPKPVDLKRIESGSRTLEDFVAALLEAGEEPWTSPFAASGAKPPPTAPLR